MIDSFILGSSLPRITARFTPQAWVNDYAIAADADGETEWDATADVLALTAAQINGIEDAMYSSDTLRESDAAPDWVRQWSGPFSVTVQGSIEDFLFQHGVLGAVTEEKVAELRVLYDVRPEAADEGETPSPVIEPASLLDDMANMVAEMTACLAAVGYNEDGILTRAHTLMERYGAGGGTEPSQAAA